MTKAETPEQRSRTMRSIGCKATGAELAVRTYLRQFGTRMMYNVPSLPGKPDIAIYSAKTAIRVHGCFWHGHSCKRGARVPKSNTDYWVAKVTRNRTRDMITARALRQLGWKVITVWECEIAKPRVLARKLNILQIGAMRRGAKVEKHRAEP